MDVSDIKAKSGKKEVFFFKTIGDLIDNLIF
jgi:hypothetical protein